MILLEQNIELQIYHLGELRKYNVVELFKDDVGMSFEIFYRGEYMFTLIPEMHDALTFKLSCGTIRVLIDWTLYFKIEAALYSVFLKSPVS